VRLDRRGIDEPDHVAHPHILTDAASTGLLDSLRADEPGRLTTEPPEPEDPAMDVSGLLLELFGRIPPLVSEAVDGLGTDDLTWQPAPQANTIAWLIWHLTRVQDDHIAEILGVEQLWVTDGWSERFGMPADPTNTGYGHTPGEMLAVEPSDAAVLIGYHSGVDARTSAMIAELGPADLDRVVDRSWNPPVTLGVRLVSVADDSLQHAGQAAYLRGLLGR
jgi:hypothetical protein